jgi:hypothetical protein
MLIVQSPCRITEQERREFAPSISLVFSSPRERSPKGERRTGLAHVYNLCGSVTEYAQGDDPVQEFMVT